MNINFGESYFPVKKKSLRNFANFSTRGKFPIECFWKGLFSMSCGQLQQEFCMSNGFGLVDFWMNPWGKSQQVLPSLYEIKDTTVFLVWKGFYHVAKNMLFPHQLCSGHTMIDRAWSLSRVAPFQLNGSV